MVVSVGPYRFSSLIRSPNTSIHLFTSVGLNTSPDVTTYFIASKYLLSNPSLVNAPNTDGTQCNTSPCSTSSQSLNLPGDRMTSRLSGAQTTPPAHNGTNASLRNPSNEGETSWLTRVPGPTPRVSISHRMK